MPDLEGVMLTFDRDGVRELRTAYEAALEADEEVFEFRGAPLVTQFAYYLLTYLEELLQTRGGDYRLN